MFKDKVKPFFITLLFLVLAMGLAFIAPWQMSYDAARFMLPWLDNMKTNGILAMYKPVELAPFPMDYPPLYYSSMFVAIKNFVDMANREYSLFFIRLFPVIITAVCVFFVAKFISAKWGFIFALFPAILIGSGIMAQSDAPFLFLIFLFFFFYFEKENLTAFSIVYALMVCLKLQGVIFSPSILDSTLRK